LRLGANHFKSKPLTLLSYFGKQHPQTRPKATEPNEIWKIDMGRAKIVKKSIKVKPKRGRPPSGGREPFVGIRLPAELIANVDAWAKEVTVRSRSEAIRRLVEFALARSKSAGPPSAKIAERARQLAAKTIDHILDPEAPIEEAANRKRRLLKGPEEFREMRVDLQKET
jgi:hypothetical protein